MKTPPVLTVTQLNTYIKSVIDSDLNLNNVFVQGEISNFTNHYRTGHYYMSIKDGDSSIKAVMFKYSNQRLRFMPENGMNVILRGRVSVFERDGQYQLYIDDMQPDGAGALALAFEQLKQKLASQGLFDPDKKKPIPFMPKRIGVVTSNTGAAVHDIINVISRRFPMTELVIAPVQVQGTSAAGQIAAAIREFNSCNGADVLIVGRGGGSVEDLWAFNEEVVARAVYDSHIPVISAVGHETDFTICDFVADLRAPTPSAAAELAVPDWREQKLYVDALFNQCKDTVLAKIQSEEDNLRFILKQLEYANPMTVIENKIQTVDIISQKIYDKVRESVAVKSGEFAAILARLDALNPMKVMQRGYAIAYKNETAITSVSHINKGDKLKIRLLDGAVNVTVDEREEN
ncbi:MAG: exodeoxyribonuclease VII large subunit [Clostridia bacterium]|nr:exodeoxyribonuclease VII large subunit [Clostridia bacterium]